MGDILGKEEMAACVARMEELLRQPPPADGAAAISNAAFVAVREHGHLGIANGTADYWVMRQVWVTYLITHNQFLTEKVLEEAVICLSQIMNAQPGARHKTRLLRGETATYVRLWLPTVQDDQAIALLAANLENFLCRTYGWGVAQIAPRVKHVEKTYTRQMSLGDYTNLDIDATNAAWVDLVRHKTRERYPQAEVAVTYQPHGNATAWLVNGAAAEDDDWAALRQIEDLATGGDLGDYAVEIETLLP